MKKKEREKKGKKWDERKKRKKGKKRTTGGKKESQGGRKEGRKGKKEKKKKGSTFHPFLPMFTVPLFTDLHLPVRTAKKTKQTKKKPDHL